MAIVRDKQYSEGVFLARKLELFFFHFLFDFLSDYFLTITLRQGGPNLVTIDHLKY